MSLMINLDDVMDVLYRMNCIDESFIDDDGNADIVRSELEQKCYSIMKPESKTWFDEIKTDIEYVTSTEEIGKHIVEGGLKEWLEFCRDNIIGELVMAEKEPV